MKRQKLRVLASLCTSIVCSIIWSCGLLGGSVEAAAPLSLEIIIPSSGQSQIAPGRDFYVLGNIQGGSQSIHHIEMTLYQEPGHRAVQHLVSHPSDSPYIQYGRLDYYGPDRSVLQTGLMPDLQYDPQRPESFQDPTRKCTWDSQSFAGLFCGGKYRLDGAGSSSEVLEAGTYEIEVTAQDAKGRVLARAKRPLQVGYFADKILSRFSPPDHFASVKNFAKQQGYQLFLDPFPGYWSVDTVMQTPAVRGLFAEVKPRWRLADASEYAGGRTHFCIYNVSPTSATYNVEVGSLIARQVIENPEVVTNYYYDIGEPNLSYVSQPGKWIAFAPNDHLQFTRADLSRKTLQENQFDPASKAGIQADLDVLDGVEIPAQESLALSGVVTPISNTPQEVTHNEDETYTIGNYIAQIAYTFTRGNQSYTIQKPVGLTRSLNGRSLFSQLEFYHVFTPRPEWAGPWWLVHVQAYDAKGQRVSGTSEQFYVRWR